MLKIQIRSEIKETLILLAFVGLMTETLNLVTIGIVIIGAVMVWLRKKPNKLVRNIMTLAIFASYWIIYGKVIDPEIGMNFLTSIVLLKLLEKESQRDQYMIFFGLMLLVSAGSLFQRNIAYVCFFSASFFILIQDLYKNLRLRARIIDILKSLAWVLPFTALLFFIVPRMINPFQVEKGEPKAGEIGYTPDVNISQLESLSSNDDLVFQATVDVQIENSNLYWRGNTLNYSDGWNWPLTPQDRYEKPFMQSDLSDKVSGIKQKIRVFTQEEFFFGLDRPLEFFNPKGKVQLHSTRSLSQNRWRPALRYQVLSQNIEIQTEGEISPFTFTSSLRADEKDWINKHFFKNDLYALQEEIQVYFRREGFTYSLSPGKVGNFLDFIRNKKIGFCSHYASSVAHILRTKNIHARLVSGFLGGSYNKFGRYYQVTQNDAHVWVEALHNGQWIRLDPTGWIAPDRIILGGEAFMQQVNPALISPINIFGKRFQFLIEWQKWFAQWDFKFYEWLERMDYYGQEALLDKLNFKREWLYSLIPILLSFFLGLYIWHLSFKRVQGNEYEEVWKIFQSKMKKRGIHLPLHSTEEGEKILKDQELEIRQLWNELVQTTFKTHSGSQLEQLGRRVRNL